MRYIFLKIYNLKFVLEWAKSVVAVSISRAIIVAIARIVVAVIVIASSIYTRIARIAIGFDLSLIFIIFLYKIFYLLDYLH